MAEEEPQSGRARGLLDVAFYVALSYSGVLFAAVAGVLEARTFGARGYGAVALTTSLVPFLTIALCMGMPISFRRAVAAEPERSAGVVALAYRHAAACLLVSVPTGFVVSFHLLHSFAVPVRVAGAVVLAATSIGVIGESGAQILIANGWVRKLGLLRLLPVMAIAVVVIAAWIVGRLTVTVAIWALVARPVAELLFCVLVLPRPVEPERRSQHMHFGARAIVGQFAEIGTARIDQLILLPLLGAAALGRYSVCVTITGLPIAAAQALTSARFNRMVNEPHQTAKLMLREVAMTASATLALGVLVVGAVAPLLPRLYGNDFRGLNGVLIALSVATVVIAACYAAGSILVALGRPGLSALSWLVGVATTLALLRPVAERHGIRGAALVAVAAYFATLVAMSCFLVRAVGSESRGIDEVDLLTQEPNGSLLND